MKSMTGFGRAFLAQSDFDITVEVSSVNRKGLEVSCSLPREWVCLEPAFTAVVKDFYSRAKVNVSLRVGRKTDTAPVFCDSQTLKAAIGNFAETAKSLNIEFVPDSSFLLSLQRILSEKQGSEAMLPDVENYQEILEDVLKQALEKSSLMRIAEGENIKKDFLARLEFMSEKVSKISDLAKDNPLRYRDALLERLSNMGLALDISDERVLKEISIFVDKCDVSEETTRLVSHISQFRNALDSEKSCGRTLDFICQEMGREINTIASKANCIEITKITIDLKNELERLREQTQNIE